MIYDLWARRVRGPIKAREIDFPGGFFRSRGRHFVAPCHMGQIRSMSSVHPVLSRRRCLSHGEILAQHAAVSMAGTAAEEQLQLAVAGRDIIGQAKGILMHRGNLTGIQAFNVLIQASQATT